MQNAPPTGLDTHQRSRAGRAHDEDRNRTDAFVRELRVPCTQAARRVLIDTNVWRYIVDSDAVERLRGAARSREVRIVAAPAVLQECLRTSDEALRRRLVKAVTRATWTRLVPAVFSQCQDVVQELRRIRPDWIRATPHLGSFMAARADWGSRGAWRRAQVDPSSGALTLQMVEGSRIGDAREAQTGMRRLVIAQGDAPVDLRTALCEMSPTSGYDGRQVECWRIQSWAVYTAELFKTWTWTNFSGSDANDPRPAAERPP